MSAAPQVPETPQAPGAQGVEVIPEAPQGPETSAAQRRVGLRGHSLQGLQGHSLQSQHGTPRSHTSADAELLARVAEEAGLMEAQALLRACDRQEAGRGAESEGPRKQLSLDRFEVHKEEASRRRLQGDARRADAAARPARACTTGR